MRKDPTLTAARIAARIQAARGEIPCDLALVNARIVNVMSGEIHDGAIGIHDGVVVTLNALDGGEGARDVVDVDGAFVAPAFVDAHVHLESAMLAPREFARAAVPHGTGAVICDPHEIANVCGRRGVEWFLQASTNLPLDVFVMCPSCVPATHLETSGAAFSAADIAAIIDAHPDRVIGVAEMMNSPGVIRFRDEQNMLKLEAAAARGVMVDGHAPMVMGRDLEAYATAGITTDHETVGEAEARHKLRSGMLVAIREGTAAKNLAAILPAVNAGNAHRCAFATDDRHPHDLIEDGHINALVRQAVAGGLDPVLACRIASLNASTHYDLHPKRGAVACGFAADLIVFDSFTTVRPSRVYRRGELVARDGKLVVDLPDVPDLAPVTNTVHLDTAKLTKQLIAAPVSGMAFQAMPTATPNTQTDRSSNAQSSARSENGGHGQDGHATNLHLRVIEAIDHSLVTGEILHASPRIADGQFVSDLKTDTLKLVVVERHTGNARTGVGFVRNFRLTTGALGSSVAHDNHNLIVVGVSDDDILVALRALADLGGGKVAVRDGKPVASVALPIAGLLATGNAHDVSRDFDALIKAAREMGCQLTDPFMTLSFLALPPIPELKLTDHGLVSTSKFALVDLAVPV